MNMADLAKHPCFSNHAHGRYGRMHIPCAPECNLNCAFCGRGVDGGEGQLPGRTMQIVRPEQVAEYVASRLEAHPEITVLGIAGPGEPLFNPETFRVLEILRREFPQYPLCLGTNGYFLPENAQRLRDLGVETVTVTVNTLRPEISAQLNPWVITENGQRLDGIEGGELLIHRQLEGIRRSAAAGMTVKVNTVYVPNVNDGEMRGIAAEVQGCGASIMNIMPLRPAGRSKRLPAPLPEEIHRVRQQLEEILPQFYCCTQCRADACGIPHREEEISGCIK